MSTDEGTQGNRLPGGPLAPMEPGVTNSSSTSEASSDSEGPEQEMWNELADTLEAQEGKFVEQDELAQQDAPGPLFDTAATSVVQRSSASMGSILPFGRQFVDPSLASGPTLSPSVSPLKPRLRPLSPMRPIIPDPKIEHQTRVFPSSPHVLLPSQRATVAGQSARTNPARESPSHRFFASPDQIDALGMPKSWVHSQVISTLGDTFCYASRSKPMDEHYDILPTDLFEMWNSYLGGHKESRTYLLTISNRLPVRSSAVHG